MINASRYLALILGLTVTFQVFAFESLIGEYTGRFSSVSGYSGNTGDPCVVTVTKSDMYGGSLVFEIQDVEKLLMAGREVRKALERKTDTVKLVTPGGQAKPVEIVLLKLGADRSMQSLMLKVVWGKLHQGKSVTCGDLSKK